jgi:hypothetical protein
VSLLTIIQRVCRLVSLPVPSTVVDSSDLVIQQLYALANEEGEELADAYDWQKLRRQHLFNTVATAAQSSAVPADWNRFISNSFFNRSTRRSMIGPITPQQWQAIQAQPQLNRVFLAFIERDGQFLVTPSPSAGQQIAYEYVSKYWARSAALVPQEEFLADTDGTYLDEKLITLGVRWRWKAANGLDYAEDYRTYQTERNQKMARDGGNTEINTTGDSEFVLSPNIPDGNFGFPGS